MMKQQKRNNNRSKTRLMDLPIEILIDILKRLPVKSVCCIRCVSKTLSDILYSPFFLDLHSRFQIPTNSLAEAAPQLVLRHAQSKWVITERKITTLETLNHDVDDGEGDHTLSDVILYSSHERNYSDVVFVFYDLIFYRPGRGDCCLINPLCGEILRIPTSNILSTKFGKDLTIVDNSYGMGFDNITDTYKIIRVSQVNKKGSLDLKCQYVAQLLVLGTSSWREVPLPFSSVPHSYKSVCAYGDMHWLMYLFTEAEDQIQMVTFDSRREEFYVTSIPVKSDQHQRMRYIQLISLGKSIAIVDTFSINKMEIWVMKDYSKKEWNLEHIIMHGLDDHFRFFRANCCEMEYGIYFLDHTAGVLLFVDLRPSSMKCVSFPVSKKNGLRIFSLKRSLISLRKFGNLVENPKTFELHCLKKD